MKYIVYQTTNLINDYIYIGVHKTENPDIFDGYIGNGVYVNQPSTYKYSKTSFQIAVNQFGVKNFRRSTIGCFDSEEEACALEGLIVNEEFLSRPDVYNMVLGGEINECRTSKCYQYSDTGKFIKEFDSISEAASTVNKSVQGVSRAIYLRFKCAGFFWALEKKDSLDLSSYIGHPDNIKVYRYLKSGEFDKEFESITSAAKESDTQIINVSRSAKLGYAVGDYYFLFEKASNYSIGKTNYIKNRKVYQYDKDGSFIKEYDTQAEAEKCNPNSNITKSIKNKKPCTNGFIWGLEKLEKYCSQKTLKKKVGKFNTDGELLETYDSIKDCCNKTGISNGYVSVGKKYNGYIYKCI